MEQRHGSDAPEQAQPVDVGTVSAPSRGQVVVGEVHTKKRKPAVNQPRVWPFPTYMGEPYKMPKQKKPKVWETAPEALM